MKDAPAFSAASSASRVVTVPAPTFPRPPIRSQVSLIRSVAPAVFIVTSMLQRPPSTDAGTSFSTSSRLKKRRIPTTGSLRNRSRLNVLAMSFPRKDPIENDLLPADGEQLRVDGPEPRP